MSPLYKTDDDRCRRPHCIPTPAPTQECARRAVAPRCVSEQELCRRLSRTNMHLAVVVGFAVFAAGYSCVRHFFTDKTIRFKRQNRAADAAAANHDH